MVANPALNHLVFVEFKADHGLVALAVERLIRAALQLIVLLRTDGILQTVPHVGLVLGLVPPRKLNHNCLVVNDCPGADLASGRALRAVQYLDSVVSLQKQVELGCLPWQREL